MGIFKYLRKVWRNEADVYGYENRTLHEAGSFLITFFVCIGLLAFQPLRAFLKWMAYFSIASVAIFMLCAFLANMRELAKSFRYAKKLEKLGSSVEEEEMARRNLCAMEGDDGLPSEKDRRIIFFVDYGALNYYAMPLYNCFLEHKFRAECMHLPENAEIYTATHELEKLHKAEMNCKSIFSPYIGYTNFIRASIKTLEKYEEEKHVDVIPFDDEKEHSMDDGKAVIAAALRVHRKTKSPVLLLSTCEEWSDLASKNGILFVNPQKLGKK